MTGNYDLFDGVDYTADSESSPRTRAINTLQIHHGTIISYSGLRALMAPGGRQVSANGAMANDGTLIEVVPTPTRRAFTSASSFDNQCLTVEACNTTLGPEWGISPATRSRFARLAVDMFMLGLLDGLHRGIGGILGHYEVPGTYATACPGPDMHLDAIAAEANALYAARINPPTDPFKVARESEPSMYHRLNPAAYGTDLSVNPVYESWRNPATGKVELFVLPPNLGANAANVAIPNDWGTLSGLAAECGYAGLSEPAVLTADESAEPDGPPTS